MFAAPSRDTDKSLRVLIVGSDPALEEEFRSALDGVPDRQGTIFFVDAYRDAVDVARRREPNLVLIEIDRAPAEIASLARDVHAQVPDAVVAAVFTPDHLEQGGSEGATLIELLRAQVLDFVRRPIAATELRAVLDRLFARRQQTAAAAAHGRVAAFVSNKGGVGKSTLSVNVACGLALRHPDDVLLVDMSLQIGSCAMLLDLKPTTSLVDAIRERERLDKTLLRHLTLRHSSGLRVLAAPPDALESAEVDDEAISRILSLARRSFRFVVVDTFPMLDSVLMAILDMTDVAFVVTQGTAPAVAGLARLLPVLEGLGLPLARQRVVLNYNYKPFLGNLQPIDIANRLQRTVDVVVPYERGVLTSTNTGTPHVLTARRWNRFAGSIESLVDAIDTWTPDAPGHVADRREIAIERETT